VLAQFVGAGGIGQFGGVRIFLLLLPLKSPVYFFSVWLSRFQNLKTGTFGGIGYGAGGTGGDGSALAGAAFVLFRLLLHRSVIDSRFLCDDLGCGGGGSSALRRNGTVVLIAAGGGGGGMFALWFPSNSHVLRPALYALCRSAAAVSGTSIGGYGGCFTGGYGFVGALPTGGAPAVGSTPGAGGAGGTAGSPPPLGTGGDGGATSSRGGGGGGAGISARWLLVRLLGCSRLFAQSVQVGPEAAVVSSVRDGFVQRLSDNFI
jgi:hypothetical protein